MTTPDTGRLERIEAWAGEDDTHPDLVHLTYEHDDVGNLEERSNLLGGAGTEDFEYDALHRLIKHQRTGAADLEIDYDGLGNIRTRTDVGTYTYDDDDRPHAVRSAGSRTYDYDANGAMTQRNGQTVDYGIHHKPTRMNHSGGRSTLIEYGPNRERFRRTDLDLSGPDDLYTYVGNVEFIIRGAVPEVRRNLPGGVVINHAVQAPETSVVFGDHLGSPVVITNTAGIPQQDQSFDAWGRRRAEDGSPLTDAEIQGFNTDHTTTGLTGHEMLDPTVLVHMNGRVYEPTIGRFLSPDPFIQAPRNTQSFNRYSYVWNNPLSYTDPSGYFCDECPPTTIRTFRPLLESHGALFGFDPQQAFKNRTAQFAGAFSTSGTRRAVMGMRSGQVPWLEDWGRSILPQRALGILPHTSIHQIADVLYTAMIAPSSSHSFSDADVSGFFRAIYESVGMGDRYRGLQTVIGDLNTIAEWTLTGYAAGDCGVNDCSGAEWLLAISELTPPGKLLGAARKIINAAPDLRRAMQNTPPSGAGTGGGNRPVDNRPSGSGQRDGGDGRNGGGDGGGSDGGSGGGGRGRHTPDQQALLEIVNEATNTGRKPLSVEDADTVLDWAEEVDFPDVRASAGDVADPSNWRANPVPHIHIGRAGRLGHVPVEPGLVPRTK